MSRTRPPSRPPSVAAAKSSSAATSERSASRSAAAGPDRPGARRIRLSGLGRWLAFATTIAIGIRSRAHYFDSCVHDDAYISFRYARNLVQGHGLVMNPGERVEGYTNFLWTLLSAPVVAVGWDPARCAQIVGTVISLGLMLAAFLYTEKRLGGGWFSLVTPVFLAWNLSFVMESLSALETMAYSGALFATYVAFLEERRGGRVAPGLWAALAAVATLWRPEGAMIFGMLVAYSALGVGRGEPWKRLRDGVLVYAALMGPFLVWRLVYYGSWLPNTFYTKVGFTAAQVARGWRFTNNGFAYTMTWALLAVAAVMSLAALLRPGAVQDGPPVTRPWTRLLAGKPRGEAIAVALLLTVTSLVYVLLVGGDYEPTNRLQVPVVVLVSLLFQEGLRTFVLLFRGTRTPVRIVTHLAALAAAAACFWTSWGHHQQLMETRRWPRARQAHAQQLRAVGMWLHENTPPATVVALSSIGAISWYADRPIVDMMGLIDRHISHLRMPDMGHGPPGHEKGDGAYVLARKPDILLFDKGMLFPNAVEVDRVLEGARGVSELEIVKSPRFFAEYDLRHGQTPLGVLHYFERRP